MGRAWAEYFVLGLDYYSLNYNNMQYVDTEREGVYQKRLIVSGFTAELYIYGSARNYGFTWPSEYNGVPITRSRSVRPRRSDNIRRAKKNITRLVDCNIHKDIQPKFVTYTMRDVIDVKVANRLFTAHIRKLQNQLGHHVEYLAVPEYQKRGAVHYHAIFFNINYMTGIKELWQSLWSHGYTKVVAMQYPRRTALYLEKSLGDSISGSLKSGNKSYFVSRGLKRPIASRNIDTITNFLNKNKVKAVFEQSFTDWGGSNVRVVGYEVEELVLPLEEVASMGADRCNVDDPDPGSLLQHSAII